MSRRMLLLADDELLIRRLVKPHLEKAGFETVLAENGAEAFELIIKQPPEVIILDIMMPEMDGMALLRLLKSMESTKSIPVLLISVTYDNAAQNSAKALGAAGFLTKPFSPAQLLAEISRVCEANKQEREVGVKAPMSKELQACLDKWQKRGKFRVTS